ncbi:hypothetical protein DICPUDRAFT_158317 [Dictyostelium purpureum]|uniref:Uncharacterized protein n=1 Tax=Dictyostelium purpureum TaxID=5786 RepID=F1A1B1_DICPU|nr:uncharacterized protein DICPUDRAFT_158317 [Dictyostelium purpureum]EGC30014.1 hypothetical protein DICPUDRAFT_158317 [Dictyostelium purpureum]|eukprot:XP_003293460.1 hypothetical protein DICPUDRAFT_158317 [Dictyostelium purpureum]
MKQKDAELEKFKRVKAIIDGSAKPYIPKTSTGSKKTNSMMKSFGKKNNKKNQDDDIQDKYSKYLDDEDQDDGQEELDSYKLPRRFDDEEIEEDEAFDEDDEETSGLKKKDRKDFEDEYGNDDFVDLSELLDDDTPATPATKPVQAQSKKSQNTKPVVQDSDEEDDEEDEEGDSDDDSEDLEFSENEFDDEAPSEEDDNVEDGVNSNLLSIVKNLEKNQPRKSTKKLADMTESVGSESLFGMFPTADENGTIDINDLMSFMPNEFEQFKQQIEDIADKSAISAPLSKFEKDKIQRRITTEQAHKILTQWVPFVREQRDKNLKFDSKVVVANTSQSLANSFQKSDLNDEINRALQESGAVQKLKQEVDPIEAKRQLRETIKLRNIMYYQELKDKRRKKIKSKKYRKILKKEKEREAKKLEDRLKELDPDFAKKLAEKAEEKRILERMTMKHKNHSKFMGQLIKGGLNKEKRQDMNEQRKLADEIMAKANRFNDSEDEDDSDDSEEYDSEDEQETNSKSKGSKIDLSEVDQQALSDKERIQLKLQKLGKPTNLPEKGINAMKFMQKALERDLDDSIKKMNGVDDYEQNEIDEQEKLIEQSNRIAIHKQVASNKQSSNKIMSTGQLVEKAGFGSGHKVKSGVSIDILGKQQQQQDEEIKKVNNKKQQENQEEEEQVEEELDEENPWLEVTKTKKKSKKEKKKQSTEFLISLNNLNNNSSNKNLGSNNSKEKVKNGDLPISMDTTEKDNSNNNNSSNKRKLEDKEDNENKKSKKSVGMSLITSNKQKDLLLEAFAQDNIEDEFMDEKKQILEEDVPEEKSNFLPGWGSWVGDGAKQRDNSKRDAALKRKRQEKLKEAAKRRLDAQNSRVIIDEKAPLEGASKYILNKLPQHYSNKEQYESTLSIAHGKDWNSTTAFRKLIEPKVSVLPGTFINPVSNKDKQEFIMKKKEEKNKKSKK